MRGRKDPELKAKCLRLRIDKRMSLGEICQATGVPKGTLSGWLTGYPLTQKERKEKSRKNRKSRPKKSLGEASRWNKIIGGKSLTRHTKSKIGEAAVLFRLVLHECEVYGSPFDGDSADWVVKSPSGTMIKIQVKWAYKNDKYYGLPYVRLVKTRGHNTRTQYEEGDFDFVVGYCLYNDSCYVWSFDEVKGKKSVAISEDTKESWNKLLRKR